ncbi:MAG: ABC transporter permease [Planctomycetota bacterium]|jgi:peptide/nickel transport system permease protein|nr:ABC transporter permease [Planctomycetota bacterium]MDP6941022.1 ABC transporter permease [Planctomycetota bacterium]
MTLLRTLLSAVGLAFGVSLLLGVILDSGLLGDAALREAGQHANADSIAAARQRMGQWKDYHPKVLEIRQQEPTQFLSLWSEGPDLILGNGQSVPFRRYPTEGRTVESVFLEWVLESKGNIQLQALSPFSSLPAHGLAVALQDTRLRWNPSESLQLSWASKHSLATRVFAPAFKLLRLDFGTTRDGLPVLSELVRRAPRSLALAVPAFFLTLGLALSLALLCLAKGGWLDRSLSLATTLGMSISSLAWVLFLQQFLAGHLGLFPIFGWKAPWLPYLALPILAWVLVGLWPEWRFWRNLAGDLHSKPFIQAARARGLNSSGILKHHILPNLVPALLTQILSALPFLVLGSLLLEHFFGIPGLGSWIVDAMGSNDVSILRASTFTLALSWVLLQKLCDFFLPRMDPRMADKGGPSS